MNKKEQLYSDLKRRILTMELEPGANLDEATLGRAYELSRTPVRDVLRQLAGEGYLNIEENRGAFAAPMSLKTLRDFFQTAPPVYASIAGLAALNRTGAQLSRLKDAQADFQAAVDAGQAEQMAYHNNRFHLIMGEMADNQYLWPSLQRLLIDHARIGQTFYRPSTETMQDRLQAASRHHDQFIAAIEAGDRKSAEQLAFDHWELSRDNIEMFVRPDPLEMQLDYSEAS
ncbi:MAG: GntR family transcriptional regulator [Pseudomonadota bacterium]